MKYCDVFIIENKKNIYIFFKIYIYMKGLSMYILNPLFIKIINTLNNKPLLYKITINNKTF